ncbi:response regulator [Halorubrum sp. JWXQ-INN 858]|uniref:ATP-binding response regulator n=1 Tax=Halorubrum sp. JWXQ-INN 858 TaxID=2690782 RepID=UPI00135B9609|nr:ATP-binding protein [Halorubrum sp. JWXQ-INN 858]MWV64759.1 response regulator [Halorubrum sp. JWXQ-INN 858]
MAEPIQVVHLDDEPDFARLVAANLERENERLSVQAARSVEEGFDLIGDDTDCVVSDYQLGDGTGLEVLEAARKEIPDVPVILFTDTGSEEVASRAISADVTDYMIKGVLTEQYGLLANKIVTAVEQRRAVQRAEQVEQHLHELSEQANDVLYVFEGDWTEVLFINSAYETVFERPVDAVKNDPTTFVQAIHPDDRERVLMAMERVSEGQFIQADYRIDTAGLDEKWVESHAKPVVVDGDVTRIVGYTRDISDRKAQMQELKRKNARLDRFSSVVAHDLRNPWNVAHGYLEIDRSREDSQELEKVSNALTRMDQIITNLLELARIGTTVDGVEPISLQGLAERCWTSIAHPEASLNVEADVTIEGNATRLAQLFENLFRNAIDHGDADVTITVGLAEDRSGFFVKDDGPGIPPSERQAVLEWGVSTSDTGTGFGLAIVQEIVDAHGWDLQITTQPEGGARFEFTGVEFRA